MVSIAVRSSPFSSFASLIMLIAFGVALTAITDVTTTPAAPIPVNIELELRFKNKCALFNKLLIINHSFNIKQKGKDLNAVLVLPIN